jgi:hypothetical protein
MDLKLDSRDGVLLATVTGAVSFSAALERWKNVCDAATEQVCGKICLICLGRMVSFPIWRSMKCQRTSWNTVRSTPCLRPWQSLANRQRLPGSEHWSHRIGG